jgi:uncharacterized repeat protein (TIGR03803 family)
MHKKSWSVATFVFVCARLKSWGAALALSCVFAFAGIASAYAQTVSTVYNFKTASGSYPRAVMPTQGRDGKLYGTTSSGGAYGFGTVFGIGTGGSGGPIHSFDSTDGKSPIGGPLLGTDGLLYGATQSGGPANTGVLFKITTPGVLTQLTYFPSDSNGVVTGSPIEDSSGNLYGGRLDALYEYSGSYSTIYTMSEFYGTEVQGPVVQTTDGSLYVAAYAAGSFGCGSVIQLTTAGVLQSTYDFDCVTGANPSGPVLEGSNGNLYGVTLLGGTHASGILYELAPGGVFTVLYNFGVSKTDGEYPIGALTQGTDGNLYGVTEEGGSSNVGSLFEYALSTSKYSKLYSFPGKSGLPETAPFQHTNGKFYGTIYAGGTAGDGRLYSLDMGLSPFVALVNNSVAVGGTIEILGQDLKGATSVTINGLSATFSVESSTFMTATVPAGATTGPVVVTTPSGSLTSNRNFVLAQ